MAARLQDVVAPHDQDAPRIAQPLILSGKATVCLFLIAFMRDSIVDFEHTPNGQVGLPVAHICNLLKIARNT
jgi:hypothetical protein